MTQAFTFGWQMDNHGTPIVGNGSDERPLIVGLTTKALMLRMTVPPDSFILHLDATYKLNQCEYPVLVVGLSDRSRRFHLVALFIISQETQVIFHAALLSLRRLRYCVTQKHLEVRYATADDDKAQCNALAVMFGHNPAFGFFVYFFHAMKKIQVAIKPLTSGTQGTILRKIYDLHFARTEAVHLELRNTIVRCWLRDASLIPVCQVHVGPVVDWAFPNLAGLPDTQWLCHNEQPC
ncbi:hypothetical protein PI125_g2936 [Phytophthora idaei]|nr:hypothetical protein PI125_g2936 [Phytophthora idaei]